MTQNYNHNNFARSRNVKSCQQLHTIQQPFAQMGKKEKP